MSYNDPNQQPEWQLPPQQPQHTQYPQQPYQQTGPGIPPPPKYYQTGALPPKYRPPPQQPSIWKRKYGCMPVWLITLVCGILLLCGLISYAANGNKTSTTTNTTLTGADIAATNSAQIAATNNP